jgi:ribonuclease HII
VKILGIDEAGRGCVIGPMVVAGVLVEKKELEKLKELGVKDSKRLSSEKRRGLIGKIKRLVIDHQLVLHQPEEIDIVSLNELDLQTITELIKHFLPDQAIFDVPTHPNGVENFVQSVKLRVKKEVELVGENKADEKYTVVSAASIIAKVERDHIVEQLRKEYGDFGSGYMSDPKTQQFLENWYRKQGEFPTIVRHKWSSVQKLKFQQLRFS